MIITVHSNNWHAGCRGKLQIDIQMDDGWSVIGESTTGQKFKGNGNKLVII
jgi:hypothetical protein